MLKEERHNSIISKLSEKGIVKVSELSDELNVSEMTIRRDLYDLEQLGKLTRIHGGAKYISDSLPREHSHVKKQAINIKNKQLIAQKIAKQVNDNDIIFLGAGTTIELVPDFLKSYNLKIVTNSLPLFNKIQFDDRFEVILVGGSYRSYTGSFVGSITNNIISRINVYKSFIGVNGISGNNVTCTNEEEGLIQQIILDNSEKKYIVADSTKLNVKDFFSFYNLSDADYLITDDDIINEDKNKYSEIITVL